MLSLEFRGQSSFSLTRDVANIIAFLLNMYQSGLLDEVL